MPGNKRTGGVGALAATMLQHNFYKTKKGVACIVEWKVIERDIKMILVDIYIPAVDETYDFMLDENKEIEKVILEIFEMISKKMQSGKKEELDEFLLYHMNSNRALERHRTLYASGVRDGSRLMMV